MHRRISVGLPTHLRLQGKGYGVPATRKSGLVPSGDSAPRKWMTLPELLSSVLIALPYVLASIMCHNLVLPRQSGTKMRIGQPLEIFGSETATGSTAVRSPAPALFITLAITAATLATAGLVGKFGGTAVTSDPKTPPRSKVKAQSWSSAKFLLVARKMTERMSCVALPIYAAISLGGARVALVLLMAIFTKILTLEDQGTALSDVRGWKQLVQYRRWTLGSVLVQVLFDFLSRPTLAGYKTFAIGYLALTISVVALPPPFPSIIRDMSSHQDESQPASASVVLSSGFETPSTAEMASMKKSTVSPLICTPDESAMTMKASGISAILCLSAFLTSDLNAAAFSISSVGWLLLSIATTVMCLLMAEPKSLQENKGVGLLIGAITSTFTSYFFQEVTWQVLACQSALIGISFLATQIDTPTILATSIKSSQAHHHSHHRAMSRAAHTDDYSRFTRYLLETFQHRPLLHSILVEKDSRRIFYFMCLNFTFMFVQLFYGIATGSLGLLSDSIHMFFDCLALIVGLCAAVMSKWPPSQRFPYGYGKVDTLAGFANGIFLILISLEIIYEAIERLTEGSEMQRIGELLTVSTLGLIVNLIGVTAFVAHLAPSPSPNPSPYSSVPATPSKPLHTHSHACETTPHHHHGHGNENMYGIYLHIMADTLGSLAVVGSTLLIHFYGWSGFDPIASCMIAVLIFASAIPLVTSSAKGLLLTIPEDTEFDLREALAGVSALRGAVGYAAPKFWLEQGNERKVLGVIHIMAAKGADMEDLKERALVYLKSKNMDVVVQVERDVQMAIATDSYSPELLSSLTESLDLATECVPTIEALHPPSDGLSLFDVKNELLLSYVQNLVFLILFKLRNHTSSNNEDSSDTQPSHDDIVKNLVSLRLYLEKGVRPLESRLKYQLDKLLLAASEADSIAPQAFSNGDKAKKKSKRTSASQA
ncbi:MAG: hypothetical protein Q9212_006113, partial [Teloschistes hypoglaucus]